MRRLDWPIHFDKNVSTNLYIAIRTLKSEGCVSQRQLRAATTANNNGNY